jgi:cyclic pyranopterin phosphate synthase
MVDVGPKPATARTATASATVHMSAATAKRLAAGSIPKGDVLAVARIAGISAAKRTDELIPLCHRLALTGVEVDLRLDRARAIVEVTSTARAFDRTGVEMEALVAASVASLTIYDMLKGIDRGIRITDLELVEKAGGRSGTWRRGRSP